jgi:hypothetical protein
VVFGALKSGEPARLCREGKEEGWSIFGGIICPGSLLTEDGRVASECRLILADERNSRSSGAIPQDLDDFM